jgi:hypothetical protein
LGYQSVGVGGLMILGMTALWYAPEDFSQWYDKPDATPAGFRDRWLENVSDGPVWDGDIRLFNAYSHIHIGSAYAVMCLDSGFTELNCILYSNVMSFAWEYGPEAITEVPSWQDILMTGLVGGRVGIQFHRWKTVINQNGGVIWGSTILGSTVKFLLDPFGYTMRGFSDTENAISLYPIYRFKVDRFATLGIGVNFRF